jgi:hypothetical protein
MYRAGDNPGNMRRQLGYPQYGTNQARDMYRPREQTGAGSRDPARRASTGYDSDDESEAWSDIDDAESLGYQSDGRSTIPSWRSTMESYGLPEQDERGSFPSRRSHSQLRGFNPSRAIPLSRQQLRYPSYQPRNSYAQGQSSILDPRNRLSTLPSTYASQDFSSGYPMTSMQANPGIQQLMSQLSLGTTGQSSGLGELSSRY